MTHDMHNRIMGTGLASWTALTTISAAAAARADGVPRRGGFVPSRRA